MNGQSLNLTVTFRIVDILNDIFWHSHVVDLSGAARTQLYYFASISQLLKYDQRWKTALMFDFLALLDRVQNGAVRLVTSSIFSSSFFIDIFIDCFLRALHYNASTC